LREAIGSTQNPTLFGAIQSHLKDDIFRLVKNITKILDNNISDILEQVGSNIELLRGTEAQLLAENGNFLERLNTVITGVLRQMEDIGEIAAQVMSEAEKDGLF